MQDILFTERLQTADVWQPCPELLAYFLEGYSGHSNLVREAISRKLNPLALDKNYSPEQMLGTIPGFRHWVLCKRFLKKRLSCLVRHGVQDLHLDRYILLQAKSFVTYGR